MGSLKNWEEFLLKQVEQLAINVMKNPQRALKIGLNIGSAAVSKNLKVVSSTIPDSTNFHPIVKGLYLGKFLE